jgi:uncharacterized protein (TIGR00251 family)
LGLKIDSMECKSGRIIKVRVTPGASRQRVERAKDGSYRVHLKTSPDKGKANKELLVVLAGYLGVPRSDLVLTHGSCSRDKILKVMDRS